MEKLRIAVSACLLGKRVRYDGGQKLDGELLSRLNKRFVPVPVCPEYEAGFGVPREAMRLVGSSVRPRLWTVETGRDLTDQLDEWCDIRSQEFAGEKLCGVILKSRSPSCGLSSAGVHSPEGVVLSVGRGLFVRALMERIPELPLVESDALGAMEAFDRFAVKVEEYAAGQ
jgi:uncharacterized protein YbbK (DUF523 family)